jgi:hypothetical protein
MTDPDDGVARGFALMAALPPALVLAVFDRYGRPLAVTMPEATPDDQRHPVVRPDGSEAVVRVLRVLGFGDVIPNDYFVLEPAVGEAVAVSGPAFGAALAALARASGLPVA